MNRGEEGEGEGEGEGEEATTYLPIMEKIAEKSLLDTLYCEEEETKWEEEEEDDDDDEDERESVIINSISLSPLLLLEQDLFWDDEELQSLFSKERETSSSSSVKPAASLSLARKESVEWILKINAHYAFSPLTAILAVNYLDRFLCSLTVPKEKPWMMQLAAVTCLSLAAKVEETHVPLLLDLQVEGTKYVFESKTIQRMEVLVLSGLQWRMNPVTPVSFLDHIIRRLGLKSHVHWEFLTACENLLLSLLSDPRFSQYLPSVMATATMLHVIHRFEPRNAVEYENQLLGVLKINKEEVDECYEVITEVVVWNSCGIDGLKRKISQVGNSPDGNLNSDSWGLSSCVSSSSSFSSSSTTNFQEESVLKKRRVQEQEMRLASFSRVFVDAVGSPH